jgi:glycosyltransferase involved in cell wall biosynthesis
MKILILTNKMPYPPIDGGSIATLNMIKGLHRAGNQVTCMALNTNKHKFPVKQIPPELGGSIRFIGIDCDTSIRPLKLLSNLLFSREPYIARRFNFKAFRAALKKLLYEESFDIIQLEGPYPGQYLDLVREKSQARVSLRAHNIEHLIWKRKALNENSLLRKAYLSNMAGRLKAYELELAQAVDILVPISEPDASFFREKGIHIPTVTIPAGLDTVNYPFTELPAGLSICFIGALDWLPNQEGLLWFLRNVFDRLLMALPELKFHVAGRNAPRHFEKKLKHPQILYHGEVENALDFIRSHRVMVAPLLTGSGIRIKILESMALGRPVVTTLTGLEGIPASNRQHLMVEDDPEMFSSRLVELLLDTKESERLVREARELIDRYFDTFELSKRLSQFYITGE